MKFEFKTYQRHFKQPLRTSHGIWQLREGIIISLSDGVNTARGEIAPLPWFGSETMVQAETFCQQLGQSVAVGDIKNIPDSLPACQFAFESALIGLNKSWRDISEDNLDYCYLLPGGEQALSAWQEIYQQQNNTTFKWKIGVYSLSVEIEILQQLVKALPSNVNLRLDANGGLNLHQAEELLIVTDRLPRIEFIEQPLAPQFWREMLQLEKTYKTPLALDESVASLTQLKLAHQQGWQGIFIIKAAIMGFPSLLIDYCQQYSLDVVFSSVFETEIARDAVLKIAQQLDCDRAVGFGVNYFV